MACCVVLNHRSPDVRSDDSAQKSQKLSQPSCSKVRPNPHSTICKVSNASSSVRQKSTRNKDSGAKSAGEFKEPWALVKLQAKDKLLKDGSKVKKSKTQAAVLTENLAKVERKTKSNCDQVEAIESVPIALNDIDSIPLAQRLKSKPKNDRCQGKQEISVGEPLTSKGRRCSDTSKSCAKRGRKRASSVDWNYSGSESAETPQVPQDKRRRASKKKKRATSIDSDWICDDSDSGDNEDNTDGFDSFHECSICDRKFARPWRLRVHLLKHLKPNERPFKCEEEGCSKGYFYKVHLERHQSRSHSDLVIVSKVLCPAKGCNRIFESHGGLKRHINKLHSKENVKFHCPHCDEKFTKNKQLRYHIAKHLNEPPLRCVTCNAGAYSNKEMKRHMRTHKEYPCEVPGCEQRFTSFVAFRKHMSEHNRCFQSLICAHCKKEFKNKSRLREHVLTHLEDKPIFRCPHDSCPRFYYQNRNLLAHIRVRHDKTSNFVCKWPGCELQFLSRKALANHTNVHKYGIAPRKRKGGPRASRKDKGKPKRAMASKLTGLDISPDMERGLLTADQADLPDLKPEENDTSNGSLDWKSHLKNVCITTAETPSETAQCGDGNQMNADTPSTASPLIHAISHLQTVGQVQSIAVQADNMNSQSFVPLGENDVVLTLTGTFEIGSGGVLIQVTEKLDDASPSCTIIVPNAFSVIPTMLLDNAANVIQVDDQVKVNEKNDLIQVNEKDDQFQVNAEEDEVQVNEQDDQVQVNAEEDEVQVNENDDQIQVNEKDDQVQVNAEDDQVQVNEQDDQVQVNAEDNQVQVNAEDDQVQVNENHDQIQVNEKDDQVQVNAENDQVQVNEKDDQIQVNEKDDQVQVNDQDDQVNINEENATTVSAFIGNGEECTLSATLCAETIVECPSFLAEREVLLLIPKVGQMLSSNELLSLVDSDAVVKALSGDVEVYSMGGKDTADPGGSKCNQLTNNTNQEMLKKISANDPSVTSILQPLIQNLANNINNGAKNGLKSSTLENIENAVDDSLFISNKAAKRTTTRAVPFQKTIDKLAGFIKSHLTVKDNPLKSASPQSGRSVKDNLQGPTESDNSSASEPSGSQSDNSSDDDHSNYSSEEDVVDDEASDGSDGGNEDDDNEDDEEDEQPEEDEDGAEDKDEDEDEDNGNNNGGQLNGDNNNNDADNTDADGSERQVDHNSTNEHQNFGNGADLGVDRAASSNEYVFDISEDDVQSTHSDSLVIDEKFSSEECSSPKVKQVLAKKSPEPEENGIVNRRRSTRLRQLEAKQSKQSENPVAVMQVHRNVVLSRKRKGGKEEDSGSAVEAAMAEVAKSKTQIKKVNKAAKEEQDRLELGQNEDMKEIRSDTKKTGASRAEKGSARKTTQNGVKKVAAAKVAEKMPKSKRQRALQTKPEMDSDISDPSPLKRRRRNYVSDDDSEIIAIYRPPSTETHSPSQELPKPLHCSLGNAALETVDSLNTSYVLPDKDPLRISPKKEESSFEKKTNIACRQLSERAWINVLRQASQAMKLSLSVAED